MRAMLKFGLIAGYLNVNELFNPNSFNRGHYDVITSLYGFFNKGYVCATCFQTTIPRDVTDAQRKLSATPVAKKSALISSTATHGVSKLLYVAMTVDGTFSETPVTPQEIQEVKRQRKRKRRRHRGPPAKRGTSAGLQTLLANEEGEDNDDDDDDDDDDDEDDNEQNPHPCT